MTSQLAAPALLFSHSSAGSLSAETTTSSLPSLLKSATAAPRCALGDDVNIGQTIIIVIAEIGAHVGNGRAVVSHRDSGLQPGLFEGPAAAVVKEKIRHVVVGDEHVHPAIEIVVGHGEGHSFSGMG